MMSHCIPTCVDKTVVTKADTFVSSFRDGSICESVDAAALTSFNLWSTFFCLNCYTGGEGINVKYVFSQTPKDYMERKSQWYRT